MRGPYTAAEMAQRVGASGRTVRRWLTDPDKIEEMGWRVETAPAIGGNVQYQIYEKDAEPSDAEKAVAMAAADPAWPGGGVNLLGRLTEPINIVRSAEPEAATPAKKRAVEERNPRRQVQNFSRPGWLNR